MNNQIYFFHYRSGSSPVTIAFSVIEKEGIVAWEASFCSSKDFFSKNRGRDLSQKRLSSRFANNALLSMPAPEAVNIREIRYMLVDHLESHPYCPRSFKAK